MNQSLTEIGLAAKTDFHVQLGKLISGWNPDDLSLAFSDWTERLQEPLSPGLRDLTAHFSGLTDRLTAGLIPTDLIEKSMEQLAGTVAGNPVFTGKPAVASSRFLQKPVDKTLSTQVATASNYAASEKTVPADNGTVPGIFSGTPAVSAQIPEDSRLGQNTPDLKPGFTLPDRESGQKPGKQIDTPDNDIPDPTEFRTLGRLSDMGNFQQPEPSGTGQPEETGGVPVQSITRDAENQAGISFPLSGGKPWYPVEPLLTPALNTRQQPFAPIRRSAAPDFKQKPEPHADLDPDAWYAELARKLHDEYERFYDD